MKPIIIRINEDGNIVLSVSEFRAHMDEAYWSGYNDRSSLTASYIYTNTASPANKWWNDNSVTSASVAKAYTSDYNDLPD